jgi:hypothetical protein
MERWIQRAAGILATLPLVAAALYFAGNASTAAFLNALGLSASQFPSSFEDLVLGGFLVMLVRGIWPAIYIIAALAIASALATVSAFALRRRRTRGSASLDDALKDEHSAASGDARADRLESLSGRLQNTVIIAVTGLLIVVTLLVLPNAAGRAAADQFKKQAATGERPSSDIFIKGMSESRSGVLAACSDSQCAYWIDEHAEIFNLSDLERVVTRPPRAK